MIKFDTFFTHKGLDAGLTWLQPLDAKVGITVHESGATILSFLAQGNLQIKDKITKEVVGYKKRNPDRVALIDHLIPQLPNASIVRYGSVSKGLMEVDALNPGDADLNPKRMRKLYSAGGNFQFDIAIFGLFPPMPILTSDSEDRERFIQMVCQRFDLVPVKGRGIKIFPDDGQLEAIRRQRGAEVAMRALEPDLRFTDPIQRLALRKEMKWIKFTRRINHPKLRWLMAQLSEAMIEHRLNGTSHHAPILEVRKSDLDAAWDILDPVDDIPDDDPRFQPFSTHNP